MEADEFGISGGGQRRPRAGWMLQLTSAGPWRQNSLSLLGPQSSLPGPSPDWMKPTTEGSLLYSVSTDLMSVLSKE